MRLLFRALVMVCVTAFVAGGGTLVAAHKARTGGWGMPTKTDVRWLAGRVAPPSEPPRVIVLNRDALIVRGGGDASYANQSSLLAVGESRTLPGYGGGDASWRAIVRCVEATFSDYDVRVTDERPAHESYVLAHVGGRVGDLGLRRPGTTGLAPYSGQVVADPIVFVFSADMKENVRETCQVISHEVGHVFGLDHTYRCGDLMSYLSCGRKRFVDAAARCGESRRRDCGDGQAIQNSHARLMQVLGPREAPEALVALR